MSEIKKPTLGELPVEVLLDDVLPVIPAHDLLRLGCTNKFFCLLCNDDTLWKHKLLEDFNFSGANTARTSGYKFLYRGLDKPRVFVWGEKSNGRLGVANVPRTVVHGVPYPVQANLPGVRVISLVAGGMSFHALDSNGNVHVWGTLNGTWGAYPATSQGFASGEKPANAPHMLQMPTPIKAISCGRLHSSCLDRNNKIWTFVSWGRPFYLSSPIISDPGFIPIQIECGWSFSSILTQHGEVFVWWPYEGTMAEAIRAKLHEMDETQDNVQAQDGVIPCASWALEGVPPTRLPPLPTLPDLPHDQSEKEEFIQLIQIAAFDNNLIGLTNHGHVLKYGSLHNEEQALQGRWEYLPKFSELVRIRQDPVFSGLENSPPEVKPPNNLKITHISANFRNFVAYSTGSSSIVLLGDAETDRESQPRIIPDLQNKGVIAVTIGDYHNAALTATGNLLTWGSYSKGALGLGDPVKLTPGTPGAFRDEQTRKRAVERGHGEPPEVLVPTEVRFDHGLKHPRKRFCFGVTAAGWHTGALVIDLEPGDDERENVPQEETLPKPVPPRGGGRFGLPIQPPSIFRYGHAAAQHFPPPSDQGA